VGEDVDEAWIGRGDRQRRDRARPTSPHPDDPPATTLAPDYELLGEHHTPGTHAELQLPRRAGRRDGRRADPIQAAAFGLDDLTAYSMMRTKADLLPGQSVLITGIGGGVALAALAIATHLGCRVCVTSRHQWKLDKAAMELGATTRCSTRGQDWSRAVRGRDGQAGRRPRRRFGGKATHLWCIKSLARGGAYVTPGCTTGPDATTDLARVFWNQLRILGSTMGSVDEFARSRRCSTRASSGRWSTRCTRPRKAGAAFERLESGEQFGKVVIDWR
jgi:NADPH:quinone reductase-like Zn-dependent oxidoreductase